MKNVLSLFSSAGIGELGIEAAGLKILVSNELEPLRSDLYQENHPEVQAVCGDIWAEKDRIIREWEKCSDTEPFLIYATPPCQGMSSNGAGKLLREIREGRRAKEDPRNRLIIPTMDIVTQLRPRWLLMENVPTMDQTIIPDENGDYITIIDYIARRLGTDYKGKAEIVNCADYGIPQTRKRLITIFSRDPEGIGYFQRNGSFLPPATHTGTEDPSKKPWVTLRTAIGGLPGLSAEPGKNERKDVHPYHIVPLIPPEKLWWIEHTPEGETAFNNQCCNPSCLFQGNPTHGSHHQDGVHQSNKDTPLFCARCGSLLPRPAVKDADTHELRLIRGFDTAYRRMEWDKPAPTLTQKMHTAASDKKIHPSQNRTLSLYEAMIIQTIADYPYRFSIAGKEVSRNTICQVIGESVPPKLIEILCRNILSLYSQRG